MNNYVEHANITVCKPIESIDFLLTAIPEWTVRGSGIFENWFGKPVDWYHVGDQHTYVAIQSGGESSIGSWKEHWSGVKHIGIVVKDITSVIERLSSKEYQPDHWGGDHPFRKAVYYLDRNNVQYEFIEYLSDKSSDKNDYNL